MAANPRAERRWITPNGVRLSLAYGTHTTHNRDGWRLMIKHPNGIVIRTVHFGATVPMRELATALRAVNAVRVLPTRTEAAAAASPPEGTPR